ncbi:MAG: hypothetical protein WCH59_11960 [Chitinophagia bacterium]|jgi:Rod binding domain-containing protein|nr:hypothetical protein [Chitinophagia bacterium]
MHSPVAISEQVLLQQMRSAHSEQELAHLLTDTYHQVTETTSYDNWNQLADSLTTQLNSINPLFIEDAREWNMIKLARVLIYRISTHQLVLD